MGSFQGFPDDARHIPVPSPLFGPLLEEVDDLPTLKCLLRVLWLHSQKRGFPRFLTWGELVADRTLARALSSAGPSLEAALGSALETALGLGALIRLGVEAGQGSVEVYMPNTREGRRAARYLEANGLERDLPADAGGPRPAASRPNIYSLYEENIGIITPLIAEELKEAEESYPQVWVEEAFREAAMHNRRSWRYIDAILKRWQSEGREHGEPGRHPKKVDAREWIRRHGLPRPS